MASLVKFEDGFPLVVLFSGFCSGLSVRRGVHGHGLDGWRQQSSSRLSERRHRQFWDTPRAAGLSFLGKNLLHQGLSRPSLRSLAATGRLFCSRLYFWFFLAASALGSKSGPQLFQFGYCSFLGPLFSFILQSATTLCVSSVTNSKILGFSQREAISLATPTARDFLHLIDDGLSPPRAQMDPAEERSERKRHKEYINMLRYVADSQYGIPTRCPCGGRIIDEVRGKEDYDTLPGKRFFTCKNYEDDGLHSRQPWVIGVQEEIECLTKRVEEAEKVIKRVPNLNKKIEILEVTGCTCLLVDSAGHGFYLATVFMFLSTCVIVHGLFCPLVLF
ncbi:hypothetical protein F2Q68_00011316 [Brassica cretica]|uniref:Zinc finger GRF-type domain-containing protein n=1 Tax=Brassica cretica TaxID=69181 RepID=A0A8S9KU68_BRACR|nr:hypothetical protein F2Q68_00011316 [Brassica cretica]